MDKKTKKKNRRHCDYEGVCKNNSCADKELVADIKRSMLESRAGKGKRVKVSELNSYLNSL